ncbi:MAG: hypothetical protein RLZZ44_487 [Bacteroidota bacterium]
MVTLSRDWHGLIHLKTGSDDITLILMWSRKNDSLSTNQFNRLKAFAASINVTEIYDEEKKETIKF